MVYKKRSSKKNIKSLIKREILKNEDKKVEKKRMLGVLHENIDRLGHAWSFVGLSDGAIGNVAITGNFNVVLFQGVGGVATNQDVVLENTASPLRNFPSNYNLAMIGDELYLEDMYMKYRVFKNSNAASVGKNLTIRVMVVELYDKIGYVFDDSQNFFRLSNVLEYQVINYEEPIGTPWTGGIMAPINRQRVKRVFHDRSYNVTDNGEYGGMWSSSIRIPLNRKLIAPSVVYQATSGRNAAPINESGGGTGLPLASLAVNKQQKELLTPHIYIIAFCDTETIGGDGPISLQATWSLKYSDM